MTLEMLHNGDVGIVKRLEGGRGLRGRLMALGLLPGTSVEIISNNGGPIVLNIRDSKIVLGRGLASKIEILSENEAGIKPKKCCRKERNIEKAVGSFRRRFGKRHNK